MIPKPIPFFRLGLANLPILIGLNFLTIPSFLLLILMKVLGQAFIQGTFFSYVFLFSFISSFASGIVMLVVARLFKKSISLFGISIMGALASNLSQIMLAVHLMFGENSWIIAPPILAIGLVSSSLLGLFARNFYNKSIWVRKILANTDLRPF